MNTISQPPTWTSRAAAILAPPRRRDLVVENLDSEGILVDPLDGGVHRLNYTALFVWELCDGKTTTHEIARKLADTFDVDPDHAQDHVEETIAAMAGLKLFQTDALI